MANGISLNLRPQQTAALAVVAAGIAAAAASQMQGIASFTSSFIAVCSHVLVADWGNERAEMGRVAALIAGSIIGTSVLRGAFFLVKTTLEAATLRTRLRASGRIVSGKVERAAASTGTTVPMVIDDTDVYAFTAGLWRPFVVVSMGLVAKLSLGELKAVLRHERQHQRHHDPLRTFVGELLRTTFFWMPVLQDVTDHCALGREIAADRAAIEGAPREGRRILASALLKTATASVLLPAAAVSFGQFSHRVDALAHPSDRTPLRIATWRLAATVGILATLFSGGSAGAATGAESTRLCIDATAGQAVTAGFTPFVRIMTDAAPMSEAVQATPVIR